jgi:hypothetical protein
MTVKTFSFSDYLNVNESTEFDYNRSDFIENYLSGDGYFILKISSLNCGRLTTKLLIFNLLKKYIQLKNNSI